MQTDSNTYATSLEKFYSSVISALFIALYAFYMNIIPRYLA